MVIWIVLLVFGVPLVATILALYRQQKTRDQRLAEIADTLSQKREKAIRDKVAQIKKRAQNR